MKPINSIPNTETVVHLDGDGVTWCVCLVPGDQSAWPGSTAWSGWYARANDGVKA